MGKSGKRDDWRLRRAVTATIGGALAIYGLWILLRIPATLRSTWLVSPPRITGPLAWIWTVGSPWLNWILVGTNWVVCAVLVAGGIAVIMRDSRGMRAAAAASAVEVIMSVPTILLMLSFALGWVAFDTSDSRLRQLAESPLALQRYISWAGVAYLLVESSLFGGAFVWLRRELAITREGERIPAPGDTRSEC